MTKKLIFAAILNAIAARFCSFAATPPKPFSVLSPQLVADFYVQLHTSSMFSGDFNKDGRSDLITCVPSTTSESTTVSVYLSKGDGTFQPAMNTVATPNAGCAAPADFNHDGKLDLLVTTEADNSSVPHFLVYLGNGDGTFQPPIDNQFGALSGGSGLFIADLNHDGIPDLFVANNIYFGKGDGTFGNAFAAPYNPSLIADFNGDGIPDLYGYAVSGSTFPLSVFLGRGDGTFDPGLPVTASLPSYASVVAADADGDGKIDLVFVGQAQYLSPFQVPELYASSGVLRGNGDGTFRPSVIPTNTFGGPVALADLNGDGKPDLISNYAAFLGNGDGTFQAPLFFALPVSSCQLDKNNTCSGGVYNIAVADFNGDGMPDVALQYYDYIGNGVGIGYDSSVEAFLNDSPGDGLLVPGVVASTGTIPLGWNSITTAYGVGLASSTASASGPPYPTTLGGIRVHVGTDVAQLIYVSPTQINYVIPQSQTPSVMQFLTLPISIEHVGQPFVPKGLALPLVVDTPAIFSVDSSGVAAATAVSVAPDGTETPVPVFDCSTSPCTAVPIDTSGNPVYVSFYATGIGYIPMGGLFCGGVGTTMTYVGPQGQIPGLQQINLKLTASTAGIGTRKIACSVGFSQGFESSTFTITGNTVAILVK